MVDDPVQALLKAPPVLYMFWLGAAPMTANRAAAVRSAIENNPGVSVQLITDTTLDKILVEGYPLPRAYYNLALTHRADYLRAYVMHFHGGGYVDVKRIDSSWGPLYDRLNASPDSWAIGYREISSLSTSLLPGRVQQDLRRNFFRVIGNGAFIFRPQSPLTTEWYAEVTRRTKYYEDLLERRPGGVRGGEASSEVVPKHALLGDILGPLALKYHERLLFDDRIKPNLVDYQ
ncbi:hypothetical protein [Pseudoclavibacter sp. JSM 162008]|uniref:hypothetical protein n=1 Tax=Pseudoclavibacter sp. JSM 162008 TaxID=3229855 RepID=UPI003526258B